jgi:hypothetical protein
MEITLCKDASLTPSPSVTLGDRPERQARESQQTLV